MKKPVPICGIYAITRIGTDECYVGQSINIRQRFYDHRRDLRANKSAIRFLVWNDVEGEMTLNVESTVIRSFLCRRNLDIL